MFSIFVVFSALVPLYLIVLLYCLIRNVVAARWIGLPVLVYPINPDSMIWLLISVPLRPWLKKVLPTRIWNRLTLTIYGWEFFEKRRPFDEYAAPQGDPRSFLLISYGGIQLCTADPSIAAEVLQRTSDFEMPALTGLFLGQFGHNVLTSNGERWAKQRKVMASVINERISKTIFDATMCQTTGMLEELGLIGTAQDKHSTESVKLFDMIKRITIHVLSEAGMGTKIPWRHEDAEKPKPGFQTTYIEACKVVMESVTDAIIVPTNILLHWPSWLLGHQKLKRLGIGKCEFARHTRDLLDQERQRALHDKKAPGRANIMSQLLQVSAEKGNTEQGLTEEELNGNLFLFTAAGFETTANTLSYAMMLLARHPEWQEWLFEEVDGLMPIDASPPEYADVFPKATRVMAVMLETLRLYTPVVHVIRTNKAPQELRSSNGIIRLPANSGVVIDNVALHLDPDLWQGINHCSDPSHITYSDSGLPDECIFRPSRWINQAGSARPVYQPPRGCFIPWGYGPRVCPGQKMGQVEFAAVVLRLLQHHRIEAVPRTDEGPKEVNNRLDKMLEESIPKMTLIMESIYNADETGGLKMRLVRRKS
ncbi:hypothetical protein MBLNU459_g8311t1 [Dothideomycetes sp. NU459]